MENLPFYISIITIIITIVTAYIFYRAANRSKMTAVILSAWLILQAFISNTGFYTFTASTPPRFALTIGPPLVVIAALFVLPGGRRFIDSLNIKALTLLHAVRIPVEIVLLWLFLHRTIPSLMTFEGRNFDILSGLTAPLIYYLVFIKKWLGSKSLLTWNFVCLLLLANIVITAILAAPFTFQQLAFEQPNIAVLYFPFAWLPACIVPLVLFSHLASIRRLLRYKTAGKEVEKTIKNKAAAGKSRSVYRQP